MIKYQIYQNRLEGTSAYGKYYARIVSNETVNLDSLAEHMRDLNSPYSKGTIRGILTDTVRCVRELLLQGKRVQLDDLASFGLSVQHAKGADTADAFSVRTNVKNVRLTAQGIGEFSKSILTDAASLTENPNYVSPKTGGATNG